MEQGKRGILKSDSREDSEIQKNLRMYGGEIIVGYE